MSQPRKKIKLTSPKGSIKWFKLVKPDAKFKKYSVDLIVEDTPELRKIMNTMEEAIKEAHAEAVEKATDFAKKKKIKIGDERPIEEQLDANGNPTGKFVMKFRAKSEGMNKEKEVYNIAPPMLFNSQAKPYSQEEKSRLAVFNGSIGQVSFELVPYALATGAVGASIKPTACMIHKIQQADADASEFGFSASERESGDEESEFESEAKQEASEASNEDF